MPRGEVIRWRNVQGKCEEMQQRLTEGQAGGLEGYECLFVGFEERGEGLVEVSCEGRGGPHVERSEVYISFQLQI